MKWPWVNREAYEQRLQTIAILENQLKDFAKTIGILRERLDNSIAKTIVEAREKLRNDLDEALKGRIAQQTDQIAELKAMNDQIKALFDKTSQFEIVDQQPDTVTLKTKPPVYGGRAGWRAEAARRSEATKPVEADSVAALEQRVAAAGGKV